MTSLHRAAGELGDVSIGVGDVELGVGEVEVDHAGDVARACRPW